MTSFLEAFQERFPGAHVGLAVGLLKTEADGQAQVSIHVMDLNKGVSLMTIPFWVKPGSPPMVLDLEVPVELEEHDGD